MDDQVQEAQVRLLRKRDRLGVTEMSIPSMLNIEEILEIVERCKEKSEERISTHQVHNMQFIDTHGPSERTPEEQAASMLRDSLYQMGVYPKYMKSSFDNFSGNEKLVAAVREVSAIPDSVVLMGGTGCGKTHLAIAMLKEAKPKKKIITVPELLLKIRGTFQSNSNDTEESVIDYYSSLTTLVLDDLGSEKSSEFSITTLYLILDRRIREEKKTIITTNLNMNQIEESLGARIASRLSEMKNIKINMPDYRKKR